MAMRPTEAIGIGVALTLAATVLSFTAPRATAHGLIDQDNIPVCPWNETKGEFDAFYRNIRVFAAYGQTFRPSASTLAGLDVYAKDFRVGDSPNTTLVVDVHEGDVSGALVGSANLTLADNTTSLEHFHFDPPLGVGAGATYALHIHPGPSEAGEDWGVGSDGPDSTYPNGTLIMFGSPYPSDDLCFRTWALASPDAPPVAVASASPTIVSMGGAVSFDGTGSTDDNGIVAYLWEFGDGATDPAAIAAHAYASRGAFSATLTVWDAGGQNDTDVVTIDVVNRPPVADAGTDRSAAKHVALQLDGTGSDDPDSDPLAYAWTQVAGPPVSLTGVDTATPTFTPTASGAYAFQLTVDDGWGGTASDVVNVTVGNALPLANLVVAPPAVRVGRPVAFDASTSADPDGAITDYAFDFGDGTRVNGTSATASHAYAAPETYAATLTVTDDEGATDAAQATVTVLANVPPTAVATVWPGETGTLDTMFLFDGANSTDDVAIVAYAWDLGDGWTATGAGVEHRYAAKGPYTVTLTVTDDEGAACAATLSVRVRNRPPVITDADPPASVTLLPGQSQRLAVTAYDPDGDSLTYAWTVDGAAVGTDASAYHFTSSVGVHRVNVTVSDGELEAWHEWTVRVEAAPAEQNWKPLVAAVFAAVLALVGSWSARRVPWPTGSRRRLRAFAFAALPLVFAEAATGVVSLFTGLLAIPPLLGAGTAVDLGILFVGVAVLVHRVRMWKPPQ